MSTPVRVAARALILMDGRLLLVNAYRDFRGELWCAPGGGCNAHEAVTDSLRREVREETGLEIAPGALAGVSEFHDPVAGFHQLDLFFHARAAGGIDPRWRDPEGIVDRWHLATREELAGLSHKPDQLAAMAFDRAPVAYHGLELKV